MAKFKRVKRRKFNFNSIIVLVFVLSFFGWIHSNIFAKSTNVNLNIEIQNVQRQIAQTKVVNESLSLDIQELASYESIAEIAKEAGLRNRQVNIISLREHP